MIQWRLAAAWVVAAAVATTVAWQIVSLADDRVGGPASAPLEISGPSPSATSAGPTTPTHDEPNSTSSSTLPSPTSSSTTPTTTPPPTTGELLTIPTVGGTVAVRVSDVGILYVSAIPAPGFVVEVTDPGPPEVRIDLISVATEVKIRVRRQNGQAEVRIDVD